MDSRAEYEESRPRVERCGRCGRLFSGTRCPVCKTSSAEFEAFETVRADPPWVPNYGDGD